MHQRIQSTEFALYRLKGQPTEWKEIFANNIADKRIISRIYKELLQLNHKRNSPIKNWAEEIYKWLISI